MEDVELLDYIPIKIMGTKKGECRISDSNQ